MLTEAKNNSFVFAMIKPHAIREGASGAIKQHLKEHGFNIVYQNLTQLNATQVIHLYEDVLSQTELRKYLLWAIEANTMDMAEALVLWLPHQDAPAQLTELKGKVSHPDPNVTDHGLRSVYGIDPTRNALHSADNEVATLNEINIIDYTIIDTILENNEFQDAFYTFLEKNSRKKEQQVSINLSILKEIFDNEPVLDFTKRMRLRNFESCAEEQKAEVIKIFEKAIEHLGQALATGDNLTETINHISQVIFRHYEPTFWLNEFTHKYRTGAKLDLEIQVIEPLLDGKRILDYGAGSGDLAIRLHQVGYTPVLVDALDYRVPEAKDFEFIQVVDGVELPIRNRAIDTTLIFSTLHHMSSNEVKKTISEIGRVSKRVIVKEDVFGVSSAGKFDHVLERDELLQEFDTFSLEEQKLILAASDMISNFFIHGRTQMNLPFSFKSILEWERLFKEMSFEVIDVYLEGLRRGKYSGSNHCYFVLESMWD